MSTQRISPSERPEAPARRIALILDSNLKSVKVAERLVRRFCKNVCCSERQKNEIGLAVRESVANAIIHGNRCDQRKKVALTAELRGSGLVICVQDEGEGFDPTSLPDPRRPENLLRDSGRGVFLVRASMDEVVLRQAASCGMEVTMVKYLSNTALRRTTK